MKVAPVLRALNKRQNVRQTLIHTGQHYDANMSEIFLRELRIPKPYVSLGVGSGTHSVQTARIMLGIEPQLLRCHPDIVLVYGDVNSTLAAALVCSKLAIPVGHVEAGLRSFDRSMPEEINRLLTDQLSDLLFTTSREAKVNLRREGIAPSKIFFVGNVMMDTVVEFLPIAKRPEIPDLAFRYALATLHRPSNVDDPRSLSKILRVLSSIGRSIQVVFPLHPRTRARMAADKIPAPGSPGVLLLEPLGYLEFLALQRDAALVITDSGGIQEEATYLGIPCLTLRANTERPVTVDLGTNRLIGSNPDRLRRAVREILRGGWKQGTIPPLWDGRAAERIADIVLQKLPKTSL